MKMENQKTKNQSEKKLRILIPPKFIFSKNVTQIISADLLINSLSEKLTAIHLGITEDKLKILIDDGIDFPPHLMLRGSIKRHFPRVWLEDWMRSRPQIHRI
jgi:hypothetical protein